MEVWQTSNLRRLRLAEEKKEEEEEERRTNHNMKIYMVSLLHRETIRLRQDETRDIIQMLETRDVVRYETSQDIKDWIETRL